MGGGVESEQGGRADEMLVNLVSSPGARGKATSTLFLSLPLPFFLSFLPSLFSSPSPPPSLSLPFFLPLRLPPSLPPLLFLSLTIRLSREGQPLNLTFAEQLYSILKRSKNFSPKASLNPLSCCSETAVTRLSNSVKSPHSWTLFAFIFAYKLASSYRTRLLWPISCTCRQ